MNPTALAAMAGATLGVTITVGLAVYAGLYFVAAFLVLIVVTLFLYPPWVRLRAGAVAGPGVARRVWLNAAMLTVGLAACAAFGVALARRVGLL